MSVHGLSDYRHGCRCPRCRVAWSDYITMMRRQRSAAYKRGDAEPKTHNFNTWVNWSCRCEVCREANRQHLISWRTKKIARETVT